MLNLLLTRHGKAAATEVVLGGQLDVPLSYEGRAEAERLAQRLHRIRIDRIVSSPMARALETAQVIAKGRPIEVDERLRELDYGRWEGLTNTEIEARDPELRARWEANPADAHSPGGESGNEVAARTRQFLVDLLAAELPAIEPRGVQTAEPRRRPSDPGGSRDAVPESQAEAEGERRVLVVAHGTLNRILICVALGIPVRDYRRRLVQDRANLTVLRYEQGDIAEAAQLVLGNDVSHLRLPGEAPWG